LGQGLDITHCCLLTRFVWPLANACFFAALRIGEL
jgi:hypothetical protein